MKTFSVRTLQFFRLFVAAFVCVAANNLALAQVSSATISGSVVDSSGAAVSSANVTVTSLQTGTARTAISDESGFYRVLSLPVGRYEVKAEKVGLETGVQTGIGVVVRQQAIVNLSLGVGRVQQRVTVTADAPLVNTTTWKISGSVGEEEVKDLPLNGRSFDNLITLNPATSNFDLQTTGGCRQAAVCFCIPELRRHNRGTEDAEVQFEVLSIPLSMLSGK